MSPKARSLQVYEELAGWYDRQGQAKLRDWFLVLAADTALALGQAGLAERLRQRLLHVNPHHLLRPFASFKEALQSADVNGYVAELRRNYPPETAEQLLQAAKRPRAEDPPPLPEERELKVYRGRETPAEPAPVPRARTTQSAPEVSLPESAVPATPAPPPAPRMPTPVAWSRPAAPQGLRAEPPRVVAPEMEDEGPTGLGFWVSSVLFAVTLLLGLGLAGYALVGPFMR
jgi:hypothetical protein